MGLVVVVIVREQMADTEPQCFEDPPPQAVLLLEAVEVRQMIGKDPIIRVWSITWRDVLPGHGATALCQE